jgi:creatinine amidohydrolase/Fe(II)-dependent formamide hydrolase-like protein
MAGDALIASEAPNMRVAHLTLLVGVIVLTVPAAAQAPSIPQPESVFLEDLTWMEVRDAIAGGKTTVIIPTGGTEQNGPHMVLGKHNYLVKYKAGEIAKRLGNVLVAPVVAYVPEGEIDPPTGHMRFAGTITTPQDVFAKVLEYAARSFKQHGFLDIALVGDSGGNQMGQQLVAEALNKEWAATNVRVHHISAYYPGRGDDWVISQGLSAADVGSHAGTHDTSSLMYLNPSMLRFDRMGPGQAGDGQGHVGNPAKATALFGQHILEMQVEDAVKQIQELRSTSRR